MTRRHWFRLIRPYTLPMIGLGLLTSAAAQLGWPAGLAAAGVSTILLEVERRTHRAARGEQA